MESPQRSGQYLATIMHHWRSTYITQGCSAARAFIVASVDPVQEYKTVSLRTVRIRKRAEDVVRIPNGIKGENMWHPQLADS